MIKYGLDIGSCGIRILGGRYSGEDLTLIGGISASIEGYFGGAITDKRKLVYLILEAVRQFESKYGKRPSSFVLGISTPQLSYVNLYKKYLRKNSDSPIFEKEISKYTQQLLQEIIPWDRKEIYYEVEEFILDGQRGIVNPYGLSASVIEIVANACVLPLNYYNNLMLLFSELGLEIEEIVPEIIAQSYVCLSYQEKKGSVMFINYGWGTVKVTVFKNGIIKYLRCFPSNLKSILELMEEVYHLDGGSSGEILQELFVTEDRVIKFQNKASVQTIPVSNVYSLVKKRLSRMFYKIRKDLEDKGIGSHFKQGIKVSGGIVTNYPGLKEIIYEVFHQPVEICSPEGVAPEYITALGLLKYSVEREKARLKGKNLLSRLIANLTEFIHKYF